MSPGRQRDAGQQQEEERPQPAEQHHRRSIVEPLRLRASVRKTWPAKASAAADPAEALLRISTTDIAGSEVAGGMP